MNTNTKNLFSKKAHHKNMGVWLTARKSCLAGDIPRNNTSLKSAIKQFLLLLILPLFFIVISATESHAEGVLIEVEHSGKCLDWEFDRRAIQYDCLYVTDNPQTYSFIATSGEYFRIKNRDGGCLETNPKGYSARFRYCDRVDSEWRRLIRSDTRWQLQSKKNGLCLDVEKESTDNRTPVILYDCKDRNDSWENQLWTYKNDRFGFLGQTCIHAYEDKNYKGTRWDFCINPRSNPPLSEFNDKISSLKIPPGYVVKAYEHSDTSGSGHPYILDVPDLAKGLNDEISWMKIEEFETSKCIKFYEDKDYNGESWDFCSGSQTVIPVPSHSGWNDKFSSIVVPKGMKINVCTGLEHGSEGQPLGTDYCRSFYRTDSSLGDFLDDQISFVQLGSFNLNNFSMIMASDPQYAWTCYSDACREEAASNRGKNVEDLSNATGSDDEKAQAEVSNQWQSNSMRTLAKSIGFGEFAGTIMNGDLTAYGHGDEFDRYRYFYDFIGTSNGGQGTMLNVWPGLGNHDYQNNVGNCSWPTNNCAARMVDYILKSKDSLNISNHDVQVEEWGDGGDKTGSYSYSWDIGNFHFVQLHNHPGYEKEFDWVSGAWNSHYKVKKSIEWLRADLNRNADKYIVLNLHDMTNEGGRGDQEFLDLLEDYDNIIAIFAGHMHEYNGYQDDVAGIPYFYSGASEYNTYLKVEFSPTEFTVKVVDATDANVTYLADIIGADGKHLYPDPDGSGKEKTFPLPSLDTKIGRLKVSNDLRYPNTCVYAATTVGEETEVAGVDGYCDADLTEYTDGLWKYRDQHLINMNNDEYCLAVSNSTPEVGDDVKLYACDFSSNRFKWTFYNNGMLYTELDPNLCFDASRSKGFLRTCDKTEYQIYIPN